MLKRLILNKNNNKIIHAKHNKAALKANKMARQWIDISNDKVCQQQSFKLMSYNILAQDLLLEHSKLYDGIDTRHLHWEKRLTCLSREICQMQPDILCVQEMQYNHINQLMQQIQQLGKLAYVYKKKTNHRNDGCAIIYDGNKFELVAQQPVEFHYDTPNASTHHRGNVAIMAKFSIRKQPAKQFIVANTHFLFNPNREDIRTDQANLMLDALDSFSKIANDCHVPIILTGDFNTDIHSETFSTLTCPRNSLHMLAVDFGPQAVSTYQHTWKLVDHIFFTKALPNLSYNIYLCSILNLPTIQNAGRTPNDTIGSDHFALAITFAIL